jgi:hypothetical protein
VSRRGIAKTPVYSLGTQSTDELRSARVFRRREHMGERERQVCHEVAEEERLALIREIARQMLRREMEARFPFHRRFEARP